MQNVMKKAKTSDKSFLTGFMLLSVILTSAKAIKVTDAIGVGELLILFFFFYSIVIKKEDILILENGGAYYLFWVLSYFLLLVGLVVRSFILPTYTSFLRTLLAYLFSNITVITCTNYGLYHRHRIMDTIRIYLKIARVYTLVSMLIHFLGITHLGPVSFYWWMSTRFQGLSSDPNQFVFPFIIAPFVSIFIYEKTAKGSREKFTLGSDLILFTFLYFLTQSDTLLVSWAMGASIYLSWICVKQLKKRTLPTLMFLSGVSILLVSVLPMLIEKGLYFINELYLKDDQGNTRLQIWRSALQIMNRSPFVGLGPDMGIQVSAHSASYIGEAHNIFLQFGMSTGYIGLLLLVGFLVYLGQQIWKAKNAALLSAYISVLAFGLTHYTLRHPSYWFSIILVLALSNWQRNQNLGSTM